MAEAPVLDVPLGGILGMSHWEEAPGKDSGNTGESLSVAWECLEIPIGERGSAHEQKMF